MVKCGQGEGGGGLPALLLRFLGGRGAAPTQMENLGEQHIQREVLFPPIVEFLRKWITGLVYVLPPSVSLDSVLLARISAISPGLLCLPSSYHRESETDSRTGIGT